MPHNILKKYMLVRYLYLWVMVSLLAIDNAAASLPKGFVYLTEINPTIVQDIRYAGSHNFIGSPIKGYQAAECVLTKPAAKALSNIQQELLKSNLSLKVYDCYRPQMAVDHFIAWSQRPDDNKMKAEFYPKIDKADLFKLEYMASKSGHSRGSTVDLTIVPVAAVDRQTYNVGQKLIKCTAPYLQRFGDGSIDMGTGYDCMDPMSHNDAKLETIVPAYNRLMLKTLMEKYDFSPYQQEWWHFTLRDEPYPDTYFDFPVSATH